MAEHLREPLDYLYEELPPERMAEVRKHLAACPACRADMRAVRETVKLYRQAEKPAAPAGLAARAAKNAVLEAKRDRTYSLPTPAAAAPCEPSLAASALVSPPSSGGFGGGPNADLDREFARLKEEVLGEIPKGWRTWLFHPAWTVAASVIFVCAMLIHFSPRMHQLETRFLPVAAATREDGATQQIRERQRLPSSQPRAVSEAPPAAEPSPILQEAAAMNEKIDLPAETAATAPAAKHSAIPQRADAAAEDRVFHADAEADSSGYGAGGDVFAAPVRPAELAEPTDSSATTGDARRDAASAGLRPPPVSSPRIPHREEFGAAAMESFLGAHSSEESHSSASDALSAGDELGGTAHFLAEPSSEPSSPTPVDVLEALGEKTKSLASGDAGDQVVILDMLDAGTVPQLIERPQSFDTAKSVQSLMTLAGMQMASGEFAEAWQTIGMLEKYDAAAARTLGGTLREMERAAEQRKTAPQHESVEPAVPALPGVPAAPGAPDSAPRADHPEDGERYGIETGAAADAPVPEYARYLEMIEPPEDPPMSLVRVPLAAAPPLFGTAPVTTPLAEGVPETMAAVVSVPAAVPAQEPVFMQEYDPVYQPVFEPAHEPVPVAEPVPASVAAQQAPENAVPVEEGATIDSFGGRGAGRRPVVRESVYVDTPVVPGGEVEVGVGVRRSGRSVLAPGESVVVTPAYPGAVYAPAPVVTIPVPVVIAPQAAPVYSAPQRGGAAPRRRAFTTDPYFRDY